jgi:opacity protein-like surface antigen
MKKLILTSLIAISFASAANAGAYVGGYLATNSNDEFVYQGTTYPSKVDAFDNLNLEVTVGYKFDNRVRLEADVFTTNLQQKDVGFTDAFSFGLGVSQVKALWDVSSAAFTPYFGFGISSLNYSNDTERLSFAGSGVVGISYAITSKFALDLQYSRYMQYDSSGKGVDASYDGSNLFKLGMRYTF